MGTGNDEDLPATVASSEPEGAVIEPAEDDGKVVDVAADPPEAEEEQPQPEPAEIVVEDVAVDEAAPKKKSKKGRQKKDKTPKAKSTEDIAVSDEAKSKKSDKKKKKANKSTGEIATDEEKEVKPKKQKKSKASKSAEAVAEAKPKKKGKAKSASEAEVKPAKKGSASEAEVKPAKKGKKPKGPDKKPKSASSLKVKSRSDVKVKDQRSKSKTSVGKTSKTKLRRKSKGKSTSKILRSGSALKSKSKSVTIIKGKSGTSRSSLTKRSKSQSKSKSLMFNFSSYLSMLEGGEDDDDDGSSSSESETAVVDYGTGKKKKKGKGKKKDGKKKVEAEIDEQPKKSVEIIEKKPKKKAGKKGGKKKKEPKSETASLKDTPAEAPPEVDILAEINRMKALAEAKAAGQDLDVVSKATTVKSAKKAPKKKKGPKKKLSKQQKAKLDAEQAEKNRIEAELEAQRIAEEERIRLEEERKAAIEKEKRERIEQQQRMEQLENSNDFINNLIRYNLNIMDETKTKEEWEFYVNCGRLPNPSKCDQMNTYLHLWDTVIEETTMEEASKRTLDVLELLSDLDYLIDTSKDESSELIENWKWIRLMFREHQAKSLDVATYRLLRDIENNLHRIDIPTADFRHQDDNLIMALWLRVQLPTPLPNPRKPPKPRIEIDFAEMKMQVQFPLSVDCDKMAIRALYLKYDHLSDLCETYQKPAIPFEYDIDLFEATKTEWRVKMLYKFNNRKRPLPAAKEDGEGDGESIKQPEEVSFGPDEDIPIVPYRKLIPTASEVAITNEDNLYEQKRQSLIKTVPDDIINLRKFTIIGGVYMLNLLHQPPQPQHFVTLDLNLTPLYIPKELEYVDYYVNYVPPEPPEPGVRRLPEEIEEELKKQEEELDKLILITLTWPDHVIFLELPLVCHWDDANRMWIRSEVHDLKHNEEKGELTFRTGKFGTFALAAYRYANLPYQAWELRPEADGTVTLQITAAILMVEFNVKNGQIALSQLQNSPNNAMQDIVGNYFNLPQLIRIMQNSGVDLFPAFDAFCYVDGTCEKHWPMEKHLYFNMAQLGVCFNFACSRWNLPAGRRNAILQMREYNVNKVKQKNHLMLHVTPLKAIFVDCTEVSQTFNEEGIDNMKFYSDLFYLMKGTSNMAVRNKVECAPKELVYALYELLVATRVLSFS